MGMPWPGLLVSIAATTRSDTTLGLAGASRLAPYVALSWLAGALADRVSRRGLVVSSINLRVIALALSAVALTVGHPFAAVVMGSLTIALGTPAYPAIAAALPAIAADGAQAATSALVTIEVGAFVVGPALGGLLIGMGDGGWSMGGVNPAVLASWAAALLAAAASLLMARSWSVEAGSRPTADASGGRVGDQPEAARQLPGLIATLARHPAALGAIAILAVVNALDGGLMMALLELSKHAWHAGDRGYGWAMAAAGFGAGAAPMLYRWWGLGRSAGRKAVIVMVVSIGCVAASTGLWLAFLPLLVIGAASVHVEAYGTSIIQRVVPGARCSSALGMADSVMVAASALAAALTPWAARGVGARAFLGCCAAAGLVMLIALRADAARPRELVRVGG